MFAEFPHSDTESCAFRRIGLYFCFLFAIYDDYNIVNNTCQHFLQKNPKYSVFWGVLLIFSLNVGKIQLSK